MAAGVARADRGLHDVAEPPPEGEIGVLDRVLEQRGVDRRGDHVDEGGVALELGQPEGRPQGVDHGADQVGDDVLGMVELDAGQIAGVAGEVGDHQAGGFWLREHSAFPPGPATATLP